MKARDNPFRTERLLSGQYRLQGISWDQLLERCRVLRYRAALVGPCGSGKTTLLEDLGRRLEEHGLRTVYARLQPEHCNFRSLLRLTAGLTGRDILLLDGTEQLPWWKWQPLKWGTLNAGGLLVTLHKPGRLPSLWQCRTSATLLAEIAAELLGTDPEALRQEAKRLFQKHHGNLREALRDWYDLMAQHEGTRPIAEF